VSQPLSPTMTPESQIRALLALAEADAELLSLNQSLTTEETDLAGLRASVQKLSARKTTLESDALALDKQKGEAVQEVRSMSQQIEHSREKMSRSRTERETNAAERELEELRRLMRDKEGDLERIHQGAEALRQSLANVESELKLAADALNLAEAGKTEAVTSFRARRDAQATAREAMVKSLPPAMYRKYESIRQKRGTAVAQTSDGSCSACNIALAPQVFHNLRRTPSIEQCPSCNRIIFYVPKVAFEAKVVD
jgi:uncharacterized protein